MQRGRHKKLPLCGLFTDYKHHSKSWHNSKRMRAKRERQMLKKFVTDIYVGDKNDVKFIGDA